METSEPETTCSPSAAANTESVAHENSTYCESAAAPRDVTAISCDLTALSCDTLPRTPAMSHDLGVACCVETDASRDESSRDLDSRLTSHASEEELKDSSDIVTNFNDIDQVIL